MGNAPTPRMLPTCVVGKPIWSSAADAIARSRSRWPSDAGVPDGRVRLGDASEQLGVAD
jgi:hypothetical protein